MAGWININYQGKLGRVMTQQIIAAWIKGKSLPDGCKELFPSVDRNNRWSPETIKVWVEKYLVIKPGQMRVPEQKEFEIDWDNEFKKERALKAKSEREATEKENDKKYMLTAKFVALGQKLQAATRSHVYTLVHVTLLGLVKTALDQGLTLQQFYDQAKIKFPSALNDLQRLFASPTPLELLPDPEPEPAIKPEATKAA